MLSTWHVLLTSLLSNNFNAKAPRAPKVLAGSHQRMLPDSKVGTHRIAGRRGERRAARRRGEISARQQRIALKEARRRESLV